LIALTTFFSFIKLSLQNALTGEFKAHGLFCFRFETHVARIMRFEVKKRILEKPKLAYFMKKTYCSLKQPFLAENLSKSLFLAKKSKKFTQKMVLYCTFDGKRHGFFCNPLSKI